MRHFLNGVEVSPRNRDSIGVKSNFTERPTELELNVDSIVLTREAYNIIKQHIQTQGLFEGIPYQVQLNNGATIDYYVDLIDESTIYKDYEVNVKLKRRYAKDNFFERADGITFLLMQKKGVVFNTFDVPYVIVPDTQVDQAISLAITLFILGKELIEAANQLVQQLKELFRVASVSADTPGDIGALALGVAAQIIYTATVLFAVIKLGQQFFELFFPKVRYFLGCKVKELMTKSCQYLGYTFSSTLIDGISGLTVLPVPLQKQKTSFWDAFQNDLNFAFNKGVPTSNDSIQTIGDLFRAFELMFNARTKVVNGTVQFERRDYWQNISTNAIKPALALQDSRQNEFRYNTEEIWKRYYIHYDNDFNDLHSIDDFEGTDAEYSTEPTSVINQDLVTIKGLNEVAIPFSLGRRKNYLNVLEEDVYNFLFVVDLVVSAFGGNSSFASQIENRIGVLQISNQFFSKTKLLYITGSGGKQPQSYLDFISAASIYNKYHKINEININDYKIRENLRTRISEQNFLSLLNNNYAEINGKVCEILEIEYIDETSFAQISYKEPFDYADGKVEIITINE